ncbi:TPA: P-loop ATPase, Sll1717 family [Burkholderia cenocepacia]
MLKLKDIPLGSTDAKNEVLSNTPEEIRRFLTSFVIPPALTIEKFYSRQKYYIVGLKGAGKTALLRYISLKLEEDEESVSSFVLFKSEVDEDLRKDFARAARVQLVEENSDLYDGDDYETVWRWFIYRKIAALVQDGRVKPFQDNAKLSSFIALVSSEALTKPERIGVMRLVPNIRRGTIEISKSPKLGLEFDWDESGRAKVNFNDLVRKADHAFEELDPTPERLNIFFDELELNYASTKQYQRDARLVRDLIVSVERLNAVCKIKGHPICLYAAVRSEVLNAVDALGKEINKPVTDFGSVILWNRPGLDAAQQPLLDIIEQRINNARAEAGYPALASAGVWSQYFPGKINNQKPQIYILHNSWYRPRDVVRLLISVQDQYPNEQSFILQGLEAVRKAYSTASWVELTEELKAKYKPAEVDGIKYLFYGYKQISTFAELTQRADQVALEHEETKKLLDRISLREVVKDLYRIGIIGNIDRRREKMRFSFRGDDEILFEYDIFVHNALRAHLSIFG